MSYVWFKAFHVAAVLTWVSGLVVVAGFLAALPALADDGAARARAARAVRAWDRRVATPAMLAVWALGLTLALRGRWFAHGAPGAAPAGWLRAKLVLVLALSALHGVQTGALRRLAAGADDSATTLGGGNRGSAAPGAGGAARFAPAFILAAVAAIAVLVVAKPF